ncbi:MAG TPA: hypothetical protein VK923_04075 [Euzebyales bacterium]|nr:hypothetical protein [Euzebyales bacterium]
MTRRCDALLSVLLLAAVACGEAAPATAPTTPVTTSSTERDETQEYRTRATVLEVGDSGPQLCFAVAESYPPQCSGPEIVGWDWDAVAGEESASGVTWVDAVLRGTWDGERFTVTRPVEAGSAWPEPPPGDPDELAPGCKEPDVIDPSHGRDEVDDVIASLERAGVSSIRVSDPSGPWDGPFVLTVLVPPGRGDEITAMIRRDYLGALCVVERDLPTMDELQALHDEVSAATTNDDGSPRDTPLGPNLGSVPDTEGGVVVVQVIVADEAARAWARRRWGDRVVLDGMLQPVD